MEGGDPQLSERLERVRRGDEDAARELFRAFYPYVASIVHAHLPKRTDAEDLCQMSFVKAFSHLDDFRGGSFPYWLARITVTTCLNELRKEKRRPELRMADLGEEGALLLEQLKNERSELLTDSAPAARELVEQMLAEVSPEDRLVITLLHLEERPVSEVAAITGWPSALVKVRAFRARHKLKKILERLSSTEIP